MQNVPLIPAKAGISGGLDRSGADAFYVYIMMNKPRRALADMMDDLNRRALKITLIEDTNRSWRGLARELM